MANFTALKTAINNAIKTNGNEEITGAVLQVILDAMVETLGDSAINDLENAITTEVTNRENAVGGVADDLAAEALARANKDNQLDGRINQEEYNRANADAALSRTVDQGFQTLNSQMTALNAAISALNAAYQNGYLYGGIATPSSSPSNNKCFYIALQGGIYTNFGGVGVVQGINILKNDNGWKVEHIYDQTTLLNEFYLLRQQVIQAITSFAPIVIEGDVTNAPDEEDLTSNAQHLLQFKNNAYSPLEFSGLGRKYLRKNIAPLSESAAFNGFVEGVTAEETLSGTPEYIFWDRMNTRFVGIKDGVYYADWSNSDNYVPASTSLVYMYQGTPYKWDGSDFSVDQTEVPNLVNCLTQDMIKEANTIYIIRYDYTLNEDITIPANCVLQFDGGSISGEHTITGTNTAIQAGLVKIFNTDVTLAGTWNVEEANSDWFPLTMEANALFINLSTLSQNIFLSNNREYDILKSHTTISAQQLRGNNTVLNFLVNPNTDGLVINGDNILIEGFYITENGSGESGDADLISNDIVLSNCTHAIIRNIVFVGNTTSSLIAASTCKNVTLENCYFHDSVFGDHALYLSTNVENMYVSDNKIENVICRGNGLFKIRSDKAERLMIKNNTGLNINGYFCAFQPANSAFTNKAKCIITDNTIISEGDYRTIFVSATLKQNSSFYILRNILHLNREVPLLYPGNESNKNNADCIYVCDCDIKGGYLSFAADIATKIKDCSFEYALNYNYLGEFSGKGILEIDNIIFNANNENASWFNVLYLTGLYDSVSVKNFSLKGNIAGGTFMLINSSAEVKPKVYLENISCYYDLIITSIDNSNKEIYLNYTNIFKTKTTSNGIYSNKIVVLNFTQRPETKNISIGHQHFDESLSPARPIWWNGSAWVDATGATV